MTEKKEIKKNDDNEDEGDVLRPPDGGWGWMVVFGSFMIHIVTDGVTYSFGVFYDEFLNYFQEGKAATAWILSILVGVTLCSGPLSSSLVNKWGCRAVTIAGALSAAVCMVISMFAQNVTTLYFTIGLGTGFGFGLIYLPAIVSVTTYFEKRRSLATGIAVCGSGFGTFIFAPIITKLLEEYGWRGAMLIISGAVLECILFGALFRPLEKKRDSNFKQKLELDLKEATGQLDLMENNLNKPYTTSGDSYVQRPHSMGHFYLTVDKNVTLENNGEESRLALSQPILGQTRQLTHHSHDSRNFRKQRLFDRPDVFYQRSLINIPLSRSYLDMKLGENSAFLNRRHSSLMIKSLPKSEGEVKSTLCGFIPCSEESKQILKGMLDFSLFYDWIFILFTLSNFLTSVGFNVPYVYMVSKAKSIDLSSEEASSLLSIIGIANTVGRIFLGYISDKPWVNRLVVYNWCLTICGGATILSSFCSSFSTLAIYASVFGFTIGAYVGLTSVILVDLLGLEKLTNAFGLLLLFQGVASLIGPPIAGALYDITLSYNPGFYLAGITISLSGMILFAIIPIQRCREKSLRKEDNDI